MLRRRNPSAIILFFIGLLSMTQINIVGWLGMSEVYCFVAGPIFLFQDLALLRRHGFMPLIWLCLICFLSGVVSNIANSIDIAVALRALFATYAIFAIAVTLHHFLQRDIRNVRWLFLGIAISTTACQFVFQQGNARVVGGEVLDTAEATKMTTGYSLFWLSQLKNWLTLPINAWYFETPTVYSVAAAFLVVAYGFLKSNSRSSLLGLVSVLLLLIGRKKMWTMQFLKRHFVLLFGCGLFFIPVASYTYKTMAVKGLLGEAAEKKYLMQSRRGTDVMSLLVGGRAEFFAGFLAALERPVVGHGSWAVDRYGYYEKFLARYGDEEDWAKYFKANEKGKLHLIPTHSQVVGFWVWNGIGGLFLMLYIGWLYFDCLKNRIYVIPELYGYFVLSLPTGLWAWAFSPFGARVSASLLIVLCLFVRAIAKGRYRRYLPPEEVFK